MRSCAQEFPSPEPGAVRDDDSAAQIWCDKDRPAEVQRRLTVDPHAPPKFRVYGALRNLPELADAFRCAPGTPMRPANTCAVW